MNKRTWIWIAVGVVVVLMAGCFAIVGTGIYVVTRNMNVATTDEAAAEKEFEAVRDRFKGQAPLITIGPSGTASAEALQKRAAEYSGPLPQSLHVMVFDSREGRLVRFSMPFWLLRMGSGRGRIRVDEFDFDRLDVKTEDLERAGPALLLDHADRGAQVLLWSE